MKGRLVAPILLLETFFLVLGCLVIHAWPVRAEDSEGTYQLVPDWAQLPAGTQWGVMSAVGIDSKGNIYGFQRADVPEIIVFDAQGKYRKTWGAGQFEYPHGLRVSGDDSVWVTDRKMQQVFKFDRNGTLLMTLGKKDVAGTNDSQDTFNGASDAVVGPNGDVFVSDGEGANTRVVKFSKDGKFIKSWGTKGSGQGQMSGPHCIAMDSRGHIWVGDRGNKRLQIFDQDGNYIDQMSQFGTPAGIFITKNDTVYVAEPEPENQVVIGTTDGKILAKIGGLNFAHGIAVDSRGAIYVAESNGKNILKFVKK